jgi:protein-arginine kinase activator protein McsA
MTQVVEETPRERTKRWQDIAAKKADALQPKEAICSSCGKKLKEGEFIAVQGRFLCADCYAEELEAVMDMGAADGAGAG